MDQIIPSIETLTGGTADRFLIAAGAGAIVVQESASQVKARLDLSGVNTGDQDLSSYATTTAVAAGYQPVGSYAALVHTHSIADVTGLQGALDAKQATLVSATNIKTINSTSLLGAGDIAISASPAGSSGQVQFNNAGAFAGAAAVAYATTGTHVVVTAQVATIVPLCAKGAASQSANLFEIQNSAGTKLFFVTPGGGVAAAGVAWTGKTYYQDGYSSIGWGLSAGNWYFGNTAIDWKFGLHGTYGTQVFSTTLGFNANSPGSPSDAGVSRHAAGVIEINNGTAGAWRDLIVRNLRMSSPTIVPASASATGLEGQIAWDVNYIYVCTATNTWKRVAIATW